MIDEDSPIPLPIRWRTKVAPTTSSRIRPIAIDGRVFVRCRDRVACLDAHDGAIVWSYDLPASSGYGGVFVHCGDVLVTDASRRNGPTTLIAIRTDGAEAWRFDLDGKTPDDGTISAHGVIYALAFPEPMKERLVAIDPATGRVLVRTPIERGIVRIAGTPDGLIGRCHTLNPGEAGWLALGLEGIDPQPIAEGPCLDLAVSGKNDLMVGVLRDADTPRSTIQARRVSTRELLWSRPLDAPGCALDGDDVLVVVASGGAVPALLDAMTGQERWLSTPIPADQSVSTMTLVGPVAHIDGGQLFRRRDGVSLGECFALGPPAAVADRLYFVVDGGAVCGLFDE